MSAGHHEDRIAELERQLEHLLQEIKQLRAWVSDLQGEAGL